MNPFAKSGGRPVSANWRVEPGRIDTPESELNLSAGLRRSLPVLYAELGSDQDLGSSSVAAGIMVLVGLAVAVIGFAL